MAYTAIDDPSAYFKVQLYTGNGSANHAITFDDTDTDMQPDFVWIKNRDANDSSCLFDSVRGATKVIHSDGSAAEVTDTDTLDSFTSDGFQVDADVKVNTNTEKYVAWCWKESATAGFDIVAYTGNGTSGRTVAHSLSAIPDFFTVRRTLSDGDSWRIYHKNNTAAPETDYLVLDTNAATADNAAMWNDTAPDSSNFTLGNAGSTNENTKTFISYLFRGVQGFSKFGSYVGNGNADGACVFLGFRPALLIIKRTDGAKSWMMFDTKRNAYNETNDVIRANNTAAESDSSGDNSIDILSNGFKMTGNGGWTNTDARAYIYAAFAENPFVTSGGVPCTAR